MIQKQRIYQHCHYQYFIIELYTVSKTQMSQRKVLIKYYPKNFDPKLLVKRGRGKDKLVVVRNMLPMSLRCNVCSNYLYIGTKFNMRMEICNEETYLGIKVFRFYLKCTYCYNDISFKTDPKNHDYIVEDGGTRNYQPLKDAQQAQKMMKRMRKEEKQGNSMKFLETKTYDSKREMELMQALDDIKNLNKRQALIDPQDLLNNMFVQQQQDNKFTQQEQREIDARFDQLRKRKLAELKGTDLENQVNEQLAQINEQNEQEPEQPFNNELLPEFRKIYSEQQQPLLTPLLQHQLSGRALAMSKSVLFQSPVQKAAPLATKSKLQKIKHIKKAGIVEKQLEKKKSAKANDSD